MAMTFSPACDNQARTNEQLIIGRDSVEVKNSRLTPEILFLLGQVDNVMVSPDTQTVLYSITYTDIASNKHNCELFTVSIDGSNKKQVTHSPLNESNPVWIKNGKKIAFLYDGQIWEMNLDGSNRTQISNYQKTIEGFKFSPDGKKILFVSRVKSFEKSSEKYNDLDKASGRIINDLMYRHWDKWIEDIPHPFIADYDGKSLSNIVDILEGEPYASPILSNESILQLDWSPDSKIIAYTSQKQIGKELACSTNSNIYFYDIQTRETKYITEGMTGYDINPKFSPNGRYIAWQSMERDGYESDKKRLFVMDLVTGNKDYITVNFDYNVDKFCWGNDNCTIFFVTDILGTSQLFRVNINDRNSILELTKGVYNYVSVAIIDDDHLIGLRQSMSAPNEIYTVNLINGEQTNISQENTDILKQIKMGRVEARWIKTTTNEDMLTWVVYPPDFDTTKKYPTILYCQGGPQIMVGQFWSVRWNFQLMAANDYIIVAPNRHGVPGFGQAWNEQISGDWGGQNMKDYLSAIDVLAKESYVDETRLGCAGASYGGFSVFWLAGNHNKRFKAFFAHAGVFNLEAQYLETEEVWFGNWDLGGPFWETTKATVVHSYASSPHLFVKKWDTPIMISHGELDYRVPVSQGMMAFNAAQLLNIPSRLLIYPNENHWILQPQNGILMQREFFQWFDKWLK